MKTLTADLAPSCGSLEIIVWNLCLEDLNLYAFIRHFHWVVEPGTYECGMFMWTLGNLNLYVELFWNLKPSWNLRSVEPWGTSTLCGSFVGPGIF